MATVRIPPVLRPKTGGDPEVEAAGGNVGEVLRALTAEHPEPRSSSSARTASSTATSTSTSTTRTCGSWTGSRPPSPTATPSSSCRRWPAAEPLPTGKLLATDGGRDLVLSRTFGASIEEIWAEVTESERTGRWFASWTGDPAPGATIAYTMLFEEGAPEAEMLIEACEAPRHLAVRGVDEHGGWRLELAAAGHPDGATALELVHHLDEGAQPGLIRPGWEYYLDMLVAAHAGSSQPSFDDYFPAQQPYYEGLVPE